MRSSWGWLAIALLGGCAKHGAVVDQNHLPGPSEVAHPRVMSPGIGNPGAPVVIVMASDYACPHCGAAFGELRAGLESRPDVQLRVMPYPLDGACVPGISSRGGLRCELAVAAECASQLRAYDRAAPLLYADPTQERIESLWQDAQIDRAAYDACRRDTAALGLVKADVAEIQRVAEIEGVPTFWVFRDGRGSRVDDNQRVLEAADQLR